MGCLLAGQQSHSRQFYRRALSLDGKLIAMLGRRRDASCALTRGVIATVAAFRRFNECLGSEVTLRQRDEALSDRSSWAIGSLLELVP